MMATEWVIMNTNDYMSFLIADAGATKTSWAIVDGDHEKVVRTSGMNPQLKVDAEIESVLFDELAQLISPSNIKEVFFYGAGCGAFQQAERIRKLLGEFFRNTNIVVKTDLEGAGLAIFNHAQGIVAISGTGSSAGFMEGGRLVDIMPSKPYPEGDEGSGSKIGAYIMRDYFNKTLPASIRKIIDSHRKLELERLFIQFQDPVKSKLIASKALHDIVSDPGFKEPHQQEYLKQVVMESVELFFNQLKNHFKNALAVQPIRFVGSTVAAFEPYFREFYKSKGIFIDEIQRSPIHGLIRYHKYRK